MDKELAGLEGAFREQLEYMGYTESDIQEMLSSYSDGECLVLTGPADMTTAYVMIAIAFIVLLLAIFLLVRNYRKEVAYDEMKASGMTKPEGMTKRDMSTTTSQTTYYVNK